MPWKVVSMVAVGLMPLTVCAAEPANRLHTLRGKAQGTTYSIKFWGEGDRGAGVAAVQKRIDDVLDRIDRQFSTYRDDSEISRFNGAPAGRWFPVSEETAFIVHMAKEWSQTTGGALDVTVGPALKLWHFGPQGKNGGELKPPTEEQLRDALARVGSQHLSVRQSPPAIRKDLAGVEVDLSALVPGHTVDLLRKQVFDCGYLNVMVELGGEIQAFGERPDGRYWRVGVERPPKDGQPAGNDLARVVPLYDMAMTTAGDFRNTRAEDGKRYTHIIDPRTGRALPYRGASVTVLAESAFAADAMDTALMVMGPEAGYGWCVEQKVAALFQTRDPKTGKVVERTTPRFEEWVTQWERHGAEAE
jgi:thiamine biosynthesis lipoprotein